MFNQVEHIGIAVKDLKQVSQQYSILLNRPPYKTEVVASEKVKTAFFRSGDSKIELLEATDPASPIARFIAKRGEGIHHIAFEVSDIRKEMQRLSKSGFVLLHDEPKRGADNKWVCFLHPKNTHGVLIELCQEV